jgi:hypothetical protein
MASNLLTVEQLQPNKISNRSRGELFEHGGSVGFDSSQGQVKLVCDQFVRNAITDQIEQRSFASGQLAQTRTNLGNLLIRYPLLLPLSNCFLQALNQRMLVDRFGEKIDRSVAECASALCDITVARDQNDWQLTSARGQPLLHSEAIDDGHADIEHKTAYLVAFDISEEVRWVSVGFRLQANRSDQQRQRVSHRRVVVNQIHGRLNGILHDFLLDGSIGRISRNSAPLDVSAFSTTLPP